jgi:RNA polymerase sigma-70 factor, ECF subfamily
MEPIISKNIIHRLKAGDVTAFDEFYSITKDQIYKTVYVLAPNKQEVDEMVNEMYFQVWKSIKNYNEGSPFNYWLNGLVFRQVKHWRLNAWKRHNLFDKLLKNKETEIENDVVNSGDDHPFLLSIIDKMSFKLKEVILLYYFYNYSQNEIAIILNIPVGTVKSRHHSALNYLRKFYKNSEGKEWEVFINVK